VSDVLPEPTVPEQAVPLDATVPRPTTPPPGPAPDEEGWQRLDIRKLLLDPVKTLGQFLIPAVVAFLGISSSGSGWPPWALPVLLLGPLLFGTLPWLTTHYRITDTQFQRRSGLLNKKQLTAPLDRIRSVDLEATLLHRVLGLAKVQIGTGVDDTRITLDALAVPQAEELRRYLLDRRAAVAPPAVHRDEIDRRAEPDPGLDDREVLDPGLDELGPREGQVLARIDWSWLRFAPFSLARLALLAGAVGVLSQFGDELPFLNEESLSRASGWVQTFALPAVIAIGLVVGLAVWVVVSVAGYVLQWWGLLLVRDGGLVRLTAGLFTTRSTSVEESRIRGVLISEPVLLRAVGGGELATLATGVGEGGVTTVLPPCPVGVARSVGHTLLEENGPLSHPLVAHGPLARRRCHVRTQWSTLALTAATIAPVLFFDLAWWLPVLVSAVFGALGVLAAEMAYNHLGHLLTDRHLVSGSGSLVRNRTALERDGVIGWVVSQSLFQQRLGLATLTATTAAGEERVNFRDLALSSAVALADTSTPGLLTAFLADVPTERPPGPPPSETPSGSSMRAADQET